MKTVHVIAIAALLAPVPLPAFAQGSGQVAANACTQTVQFEVRNRYPQAQRVQLLGPPKLRQASNAETSVTGGGQFDSTAGWTRFSYSCIFNIRNGEVYGVDIRARQAAVAPPPSQKRPTGGQVAGAVIGTIIAGAIIGAIAKNNKNQNTSSGVTSGDGGWWSPAAGVQCNSYQSACYQGGRFSPQWTHRIYVQ